MTYALNRIGQKFGDLKVVGQSFSQVGAKWWPCQCWCGGYRAVEEKRLLAGQITMCVACEARKKMEKPIF